MTDANHIKSLRSYQPAFHYLFESITFLALYQTIRVNGLKADVDVFVSCLCFRVRIFEEKHGSNSDIPLSRYVPDTGCKFLITIDKENQV